MIKIRKLEMKDAPYMLEWMHDPESKKIFQTEFDTMTEENVIQFIKHSFDEKNQHYAIVDELDDEYLGTISLKNIDLVNGNAEYAISTRKKARGTGANRLATEQIVNYAFKTLHLKRVYLCVLSSNIRAKKFYMKCGFVYEGTFKKHLCIDDIYCDLEWYGIIYE